MLVDTEIKKFGLVVENMAFVPLSDEGTGDDDGIGDDDENDDGELGGGSHEGLPGEGDDSDDDNGDDLGAE